MAHRHGSKETLHTIRRDELPRDIPVEEDPSVSTDDIDPLPVGVEEVRRMATSVGAAASGMLLDEDLERAQLRLRDAQVILVELGYLAGHHGEIIVDGQWGTLTRDAITSFQGDHGLTQRGQLDGETYEALLAEHETALEAQDPQFEGDESDPLHAGEPPAE